MLKDIRLIDISKTGHISIEEMRKLLIVYNNEGVLDNMLKINQTKFKRKINYSYLMKIGYLPDLTRVQSPRN